jgi:hypothetical protein
LWGSVWPMPLPACAGLCARSKQGMTTDAQGFNSRPADVRRMLTTMKADVARRRAIAVSTMQGYR